MNNSSSNLSNIGVRRQQPQTRHIPPEQPRQDNGNSLPGPASNAAREMARQQLARRRAEQLRQQEPSSSSKAERNQQLHASLETEEDDQYLQSNSVVLSPKAYRRPTTFHSEYQSRPQSPAILINPDYYLLPTMKSEHSRGVFDFYLNSFVTSIIEVSPQNVTPYSSIIHQVLHDELLFTAFTTCSEAARWRTQSLYDEPPVHIVRGYGKTIQLLQQRLRSERFAMTTAVLLSMGQLTAIETLIRHTSATARHLAGMNTGMQAKAGTRPRQGSSSSNLQTAVDIWSRYFRFRESITNTIPKYNPLTYPRHPFIPSLSMQIASLPLGFNDIILSGRVSIELLDLMDRFNNYFRALSAMDATGTLHSDERTLLIIHTAGYCIEYTQIRLLTVIERLILVSLISYVCRRDRVHPALINIRNYFQINCGYLVNVLASTPTALHRQDYDSDLLSWIGVLLLLTSTAEAHARKLALKILPKWPEPLKMLKTCQQFFWDEDLTSALLSGRTLITRSGNDIIADNVKRDASGPNAEKEAWAEVEQTDL